jgi:probable rRNA maturation factor
MIQVDFCNRTPHPVDARQLTDAVRGVLQQSPWPRAEISLAVVDDATIHDLNRRHLQHDYPTDVLSFVLDQCDDSLSGEIVVSVERAAATAPDYGWSTQCELLLYVIHGALHLVGYDDQLPVEREQMRLAEAEQLARFGLQAQPIDDR